MKLRNEILSFTQDPEGVTKLPTSVFLAALFCNNI